jgi:WNK lysine deficient protein kinase
LSCRTENQSTILKGLGLKDSWALGICQGGTFLHGQSPPIIHRDLKCANVLVADGLSAKITDFGESRSSGRDDGTMTTVGTPYFMAPEVFSMEDADNTYSCAVDVYSYGMLLLEIFYDGDIKRAFRKGWGPMVVMNRVSKGWRPDLTKVKEKDKELADIIEQCWKQDPKERITFEDMADIFQKRASKQI